MDVSFLQVLKTIVFSSVLFVWVVRYQNIVEEFKHYGYPNWLRDLVGILKISCVILIINTDSILVKYGSAGLGMLMLMAFFTHIKCRNPLSKMVPSLVLLCLCVIFFCF
jgi:uncharacterized membrane protein YphA (DoxX/SURF4 family)